MTRRVVAPRVEHDAGADSLQAALLEDVVDLVHGMQQVEGAVVARPSAVDAARRAAWPDMDVLVADTADVAASLDALHAAGADEAAIVCADAPDLPPLLLGKLFSALTSVDAAVCPAENGGLAALAARLPVADWLREAGLSLDDVDALDRLRTAAPRRGLNVGSGWHRIRSEADLSELDPGLEGWAATRAWLAR